MTVGELINCINIYISSNKKRSWEHLYVCGDYTIDNIYYREGYVVLQSNEIDYRRNSLVLKYILHCLKYFKPEREVIFMNCDEDEDYEFRSLEKCVITFDKENLLLMFDDYQNYLGYDIY